MRDSNTASADASQVSLTSPVRGQTTVQASLEAGLPIMLSETSFLATTSLPPGDVYATDTRVWDAGTYHLRSATTFSASGMNTEVQITFNLDGFDLPGAYADTPGTGTLRSPDLAPIVLTGGIHTFQVKIGRVSGSGDAEALSSFLEVERVS